MYNVHSLCIIYPIRIRIRIPTPRCVRMFTHKHTHTQQSGGWRMDTDTGEYVEWKEEKLKEHLKWLSANFHHHIKSVIPCHSPFTPYHSTAYTYFLCFILLSFLSLSSYTTFDLFIYEHELGYGIWNMHNFGLF